MTEIFCPYTGGDCGTHRIDRSEEAINRHGKRRRAAVRAAGAFVGASAGGTAGADAIDRTRRDKGGNT